MRQVQPIFQNPFEAFNPLKRIDRYLYLTARHFADAASSAAAEARADTTLRQVGLSLAEVKVAIRTSSRAGSCSASRSRAP